MSAKTHNSKNGALTFLDVTGTPITQDLSVGPGDFSASPLGYGRVDGSGWTIPVEQVSVTSRGKHLEFAEGDDLQIDWSTTIHDWGIVHDSSGSPGAALMDAIMKVSAFAAGTSVDSGSWTGQIKHVSAAGGKTRTLTLNNCTITAAFKEAMPANTWTISGKCVGGYKLTEA